MIDQHTLDALFLKAKEAPHTSVFNETKEYFLSASSSKIDPPTSKKNHFITVNKGTIMLLIAGVITLTCVLMLGDVEENKTQKITETKVQLKHVEKDNESYVQPANTSAKLPPKTIEVARVKKNSSPIPDPNSIPFLVVDSIQNIIEDTSDSADWKPPVPKKELSTEFVFPKLTPDEISDNNKRKKKMLKALNKKDSKVYAYIPAGSFTFKSELISVASFHMQRTEVTNLEYKTFLFDLLIQDRKDDFLLAKPKQELWTEELGSEYKFMQDTYFSGEEYEDFPVNNISRKGAQMYCDWITHEANEINKADGKMFINDVRIPMRSEWIKAATVEGKFPEYPWADTVSPIGFRSNFSMKDYTLPVATMKRTKQPVPIGDSTAISTGEWLFGKGNILCKSEFYSSNELGLYNMSGNVAEMVYETIGTNDLGVKSPMGCGTAGGGWMNTAEEIKLNAEDLYEGVEDEHLNIGFRVVITYFPGNR